MNEKRKLKTFQKWLIGAGVVVLLAGIVFIWKVNNREPSVQPTEKEEQEAPAEVIPVSEQEVNLEEEEDADPYHGEIRPIASYDRTFLPRIICWGDSLTESYDYKTAYPDVLQSLTDAEVVNFGLSNDTTRSMAIRSGAIPLFVGDCVIDKDPKPVPVKLTLSDGKGPQLLQHGEIGVNPCKLGDVEGTLAFSESGFTFTRSAAGDKVKVKDGTQLFTQGDLQSGPDDIIVLFSGANDGLTEESADTLIKQQQEILDHIGSPQYVVIGVTYAKDAKELSAINAKLKEAYGSHFLNIYEYFMEYGLMDATPSLLETEEDRDDIGNGVIPTSLRQDYVHGNHTYYSLLAKQVYRKLMYLGYLPLDEEFNRLAALGPHKTRIIFWGDSITECTRGNGVTFPNVVKELAAEDGEDIEVRNYGVYAEKSSLIAARAGGNPMRLNKTITIPADTTPVEVQLVSDMFGWEMLLVFGGDKELSARPDFTGDNSLNPCILAGVEGNVSINAEENKRYFTRLEPGEEVVAEEGTQIEFWAMRDKREDDILVIWSGTNDELTPEKCPETFAYIHSIIDFTGTDRYIVVNMQKIEEMPEIDAINELFAEEFGEHCLDIYSYLLNDAMKEAGLEVTEEDEEMLKERRMPMSIRSDMSGHFNEAGYTMIGHEIYRKLRSLGYL